MFDAPANATEAGVAIMVAAKINGQAAIASQCTAIVVGNGTATSVATVTANGVSATVYGATGATHYGVEVRGKILNQFSTSYQEDRARFAMNIDHTSGFGSTTTIGEIQAMSFGTGTYNQVHNIENFDFQYLGAMNRRQFPIPVINLISANTFYSSANVAAIGTATVTLNSDYVTVTGSTALINAGQIIDINGVQYEVLYKIVSSVNTTDFVLAAVNTAATASGLNVKLKFQYSLLSIEFSNPHSTEGANVVMDSQQSVIIAVPTIDAAGAYNSSGAVATAILGILNPYMASVGFANQSL